MMNKRIKTMPQLLGIRLFNFKGLKDITLGKLRNNDAKPLTNLSVVIGKNGAGKSSIFEAFGFMSDCLKNGVEFACDVRGGFSKLISKGCDLKNLRSLLFFILKITKKITPLPMQYQLDKIKILDHMLFKKA